MKAAVISALIAVAVADKAPHAAHPGPHHPAPAPAPAYKAAPAPAYRPAPAYKPTPYKAPAYGKEEKLPPQPFAYQYGVKDEYAGTNFDKTENQDAYGNLEGSYRVALPDGRVQIVTYHADHENGFVADVKYEGQAVYPPEPKEGYGHAAPKYAPKPKYVPAPAPKYAPAPAPKYAPA